MGFGKRLVIFLLIIILLGILSVYWPVLTGKVVRNVEEYKKEPVFVTSVIDGDTIHTKTDGNEETIRLLGINTPEKKQPYYEDARKFLKDEIEGKEVELLRDFTDKDKYNRKLRYVFYGNRLINVEIVEKGLASTFMLEGLKYRDKFKNAEKFARDNSIKLWGKSFEKCSDCIKLEELNPEPPEFFIIKNECSFDCSLNGWFVKDDANHFFYLKELKTGETKKYENKDEKEIWNDAGDRFFMRDKNGGLVVFYEY